MQGKNYGYEFPLPGSVKARERERMAPVSVAATYQAVAPQETAQNTPAPQPAPAPAQTAEQSAAAPVPEQMPATSSGWLLMLLSGGAFSGLGLQLRRGK